MLSQLSFWPWIIGCAASFIAAISTYKRTIGEIWISPSLALLGSGALVVVFVGLVEASSTGIFAGRPIGDVLDASLGLVLTSGFSSVAALVPTYWVLKWRGDIGSK